jgi:DNA gyrase subunit A
VAIVVDVIRLINGAASPADARQALMNRPWPSTLVSDMLARVNIDASRPEGLEPIYGLGPDGYRFSEAQVQRILEMQLQRLTGLEQDKIVAEYRETMDRIADLLDILARPERITAIIGEELTGLREQFGDERRSEIVANAEDLRLEDLIAPAEVVVTCSHSGYMKAQPVADYRAQRRGGRGKQAAATKQDDFIDSLFVANTNDTILCFSNRGRVYWLKVYQVPQGSRASRGKPINNLVSLEEGEKITAILPVKQFDDQHYVFMATAQGTVKKTALSAFSRPMQKGIIAVDLGPGDYLIGVALTDGTRDIMLFSDAGKAVRFVEDEVRPMGRAACGVRGMRLIEGQKVIALIVVTDESLSVLTATENGFGKRTPLPEYPRHGRGTQGVIAMETSVRNGPLVAARLVAARDEIILITSGGVLIRTRVHEIREMGRNTQGVTLIQLDEGEKLAGLEKLLESDEEERDDNGSVDASGESPPLDSEPDPSG